MELHSFYYFVFHDPTRTTFIPAGQFRNSELASCFDTSHFASQPASVYLLFLFLSSPCQLPN